MQRSESLVTCGDTVVTYVLDVAQEVEYPIEGQLLELQAADALPGIGRDPRKEQLQGIAIAADRAGTQPLLLWQVIEQEARHE